MLKKEQKSALSYSQPVITENYGIKYKKALKFKKLIASP